MKSGILIFAIAFLVGCSTIDRRVYYEPLAKSTEVSGPEEPYCGWTNFGGAPDQYNSLYNGSPISVTANQKYQPYFFGPWFLSIVPVFAVTWLVELAVDDQLQISMSSDTPHLMSLENSTYVVSVQQKVFSASSVQVTEHHVKLLFPVNIGNAKELIFNVSTAGESIIKVPFRKTSRWVWTQITPNC